MKTNPETHTCRCGFTWKQGENGSHNCADLLFRERDFLRDQLAEMIARNESLVKILLKMSLIAPKAYRDSKGKILVYRCPDHLLEIQDIGGNFEEKSHQHSPAG